MENNQYINIRSDSNVFLPNLCPIFTEVRRKFGLAESLIRQSRYLVPNFQFSKSLAQVKWLKLALHYIFSYSLNISTRSSTQKQKKWTLQRGRFLVRDAGTLLRSSIQQSKKPTILKRLRTKRGTTPACPRGLCSFCQSHFRQCAPKSEHA